MDCIHFRILNFFCETVSCKMGERPKGNPTFGLDLERELGDPSMSDVEEGEIEDAGREVSDEEYQRLLASANIPPASPDPEDAVEGKVQVFPWEGSTQTARLVFPPPHLT